MERGTHSRYNVAMRTLHVVPLAAFLALAACKTSDDEEPKGPWQTERDETLRYELIDAYEHEFSISYGLTATTPGATTYCTPVRGDTFVSDVRAENADTGAKLDVALVSGKEARKRGHPGADPDGSYFLIALDRPVPEHGDLRLVLYAKYEDRVSLTFRGDELLFARLLAVQDVAVVLPPKHALVECNVPVRIRTLADGRVELDYTKRGRVPLPLRIVARRTELDPLLANTSTLRITAPFTCTPRAGLVHSIEVELEDFARSLAWKHDLECQAELDHPPLVTLAPHARHPSAYARATGALLESRIAEASAGAARELAWDGVERLRLEASTSIEAEPSARVLHLAFEPAPLRTLVVPAGWSARHASLPVATVPLPDGRTRLELGFGAVEFEGLEIELVRARSVEAPPRAEAPPAGR